MDKSEIGHVNDKLDPANSCNELAQESVDIEKPSILEILVEKQDAIEKTVSLVKNEIVEHVLGNSHQLATEEIEALERARKSPIKVEFDGLNNLLTDAKVETMIKSVAGQGTHDLICEALGAINATSSIQDKHKAFTTGIKKLQTKLGELDKSVVEDNPEFDLALKLVGLNRGRFI